MAEDRKFKPPGKGLGRGLAALLGDDGEKRVFQEPRAGEGAPAPAASAPGPSAAELEALRRETFTLPIEFLRPGRFQPRRHFDQESLQQLAQSIREKGLLQPILVRQIGKDGAGKDAYEILAGERRWRAAQLAKLHDVPVVLRDFADRDALEIALVENLQRRDLSPIEEAQGYARLRDEFGATQQELADALGKSRSHIANMLRLLDLPDKVQALLDEGRIDAGHARALYSADDVVQMAERVVAQGLSVRQVEKLVQAQRAADAAGGARGVQRKLSPAAGPAAGKSADVRALEKQLEQALGLRVDIVQGEGEHTQISLFCNDYEQLDDVVARLGRTPKS
ncbi:MAG: ParB/RepB/Spo0J family partition protein [Reyranellaceae bacterium]